MSSISVYICSHYEPFHGPESAYVFVEGPCPRQKCRATDPDWFLGQWKEASATQLAQLATFLSEMRHIKIEVTSTLNMCDELEPMSTDEMCVGGAWKMVDLIMSEGSEDAIEKHFRFSAAASIIHNAHRFAEHSDQAVFFDFCFQEAINMVEGAKSKLQVLNRAVDDLTSRQLLLDDARDEVLQWPSSSQHYEPNFGIEELDLLRKSDEGRLLLKEPFRAETVRRAESLIQRAKAEAYARENSATFKAKPAKTHGMKLRYPAVARILVQRWDGKVNEGG